MVSLHLLVSVGGQVKLGYQEEQDFLARPEDLVHLELRDCLEQQDLEAKLATSVRKEFQASKVYAESKVKLACLEQQVKRAKPGMTVFLVHPGHLEKEEKKES